MPDTTLDPAFVLVDAPAFTRRHLTGIADGTPAAVRVPAFFGQATLDAVLTALYRLPLVDYTPVRVRMTRFGPALNDYRSRGGTLDIARYWKDTGVARDQWRQAGIAPDPVQASLDALGAAWGSAIRPATIAGRPVFTGMLREINAGTLLHYDDIHLEYPGGLFDQRVTAQLTYNVYLTVPDEDGGTTVWRRRWRAADDEYRLRYGYDPRIVADHQRLTVLPRLGDALLFNPNNYHRVRPNGALEQPRTALTFFLGTTAEGDLVVWS